MIVYHVCGATKLARYKRLGYILPLVRAWSTVQEAERFSKQTGRQFIIRLKFPDDDVKVLDGHKGMARYLSYPYFVGDIFGKN
jgi:hypothetical protein